MGRRPPLTVASFAAIITGRPCMTDAGDDAARRDHLDAVQLVARERENSRKGDPGSTICSIRSRGSILPREPACLPSRRRRRARPVAPALDLLAIRAAFAAKDAEPASTRPSSAFSESGRRPRAASATRRCAGLLATRTSSRRRSRRQRRSRCPFHGATARAMAPLSVARPSSRYRPPDEEHGWHAFGLPGEPSASSTRGRRAAPRGAAEINRDAAASTMPQISTSFGGATGC